MNVDCQWVGKNLEALFCDALTESEERLARTHIKNCTLCRNDANALNSIDPLIKSYFRRELEIARRLRVISQRKGFRDHRGRGNSVRIFIVSFDSDSTIHSYSSASSGSRS